MRGTCPAFDWWGSSLSGDRIEILSFLGKVVNISRVRLIHFVEQILHVVSRQSLIPIWNFLFSHLRRLVIHYENTLHTAALCLDGIFVFVWLAAWLSHIFSILDILLPFLGQLAQKTCILFFKFDLSIAFLWLEFDLFWLGLHLWVLHLW